MRTVFLVIAAMAVLIGIIAGVVAGSEVQIGIALTIIASAATLIGLAVAFGWKRR